MNARIIPKRIIDINLYFHNWANWGIRSVIHELKKSDVTSLRKDRQKGIAKATMERGASELSLETSCSMILNPRIYSLRLSEPYISLWRTAVCQGILIVNLQIALINRYRIQCSLFMSGSQLSKWNLKCAIRRVSDKLRVS